MSIKDELLSITTTSDTIQNAEETARRIREEELGGALYDWVQGARQGAEEVGHAATQVGATVPADYLDEQALETPELDQTSQAAVDWYEKAKDTFKDETVQPIAMTAALVHPVGMAAMVPFLINSTKEDIEKAGITQATKNFVYNFLPGTGFYDAMISDDPQYKAFREQHPLRALFMGVSQDIDIMAPAIHTAKYVRKNYLVGVKKKSAIEAERMTNAEFLLNGKMDTPIDDGNFNGKTINTTAERLDAKMSIKDEMANPKKEKFSFDDVEKREPMDNLNIDKNQKVSDDVDNIIRQGYEDVNKQNAFWDDMTDPDGLEIPVSPSNYPHRVSINDIWSQANTIVNARPNKMFGASKSTGGYYEIRSEGIRTGGNQTFRILSHEIGHRLDAIFGIEGCDKELIQRAKDKWDGAYGDVDDPKYDHVYRGEGIAEFTKEYTLNPEYARQNFPEYCAKFEEALNTNPELKAEYDKYANLVRQWYNQTPEMRTRGSINMEGDVKKSKLQIANEKLNKLEETMVDETSGFRRIIDLFSKITGEVVEFAENPAELVHALKSYVPSRSQMLLGLSKLPTEYIITALNKVWGTNLRKVTLNDVFKPLEILAKTNKYLDYLQKHQYKDWHEAFAAYAVALHSLELIQVKNPLRIEKCANKIAKHEKTIEQIKLHIDKLKADLVDLGAAKATVDVMDMFLGGTSDQVQKAINVIKDTIKDADNKDMASPIIQDIIKYKEHIRNLTNSIGELNAQIEKIKMGFDDYVTPRGRKDAEAVVRNAPAEFKAVSKLLNQYTQNMLAIGVHFGFIDLKTANEFAKLYPNYVPFSRDFSIEGNLGAKGMGGGGDAYANISAFFKTLSEEGSDRTVKDPLVTLTQQTIRLVSMGERNMVGLALVSLGNRKGGSELVMRVSGNQSGAYQTFTVWRNGKKETYQAMAPGLYEAMHLLDNSDAKVAINLFDTIARSAASTLRIGATQTPFFTMWNMCRDIVTASIQSKTGVNPLSVLNALDGFFRKVDKGMLADFEAQGVPFATILSESKDVSKMMRKRVTPEKYQSHLVKCVDAVKDIFAKFMDVNEAVELAPRYAEFRNAVKQGHSLLEAGAMARDVTTDFSKGGRWGKKFNRYTAFFNAALQGNIKFLKNFKERPIQTACFGAMYVTLPTLALWELNHDKDWYRELPFEEKMRNWFIEVNGVVYRFPKPEMLGTFFGSIPERILDYAIDMDRDSNLLNETRDFTVGQFTPSLTPTVALPVVEWWANKSFFRNRAIVNAHDMKYLDPQDQYNVYTSEVAKGLGQLTGKSPMLIDNALRDVTGSMGNAVLGLSDAILKENQTPSKDLTDMTRFTRSKTNPNTRTADIYYKGLDKLTKQVAKNKKDYKAKANLNGMLANKRRVDALRQQINDIKKKTKLSGDEKKVKIKDKEQQINKLQRQANIQFLGFKYIKAVN